MGGNKYSWIQVTVRMTLISFGLHTFPVYAMLPHQRGEELYEEDLLRSPQARLLSEENPQDVGSHNPYSPLEEQGSPSHQALAHHILRVTQAELDPFKTFLYQLSDLLMPALEALRAKTKKDPEGLIGQFKVLKSLLKDPEACVLKAKINLEHLPQDGSHEAFKNLTLICNEITTYQEALSQSSLPLSLIEKSRFLLSSLKEKYKSYPQELIQALQEEDTLKARGHRLYSLLSPSSALLWGELFKPGHFYRIPQSLAHKILDFDELGTREEKPNESGNHRVTHLGDEQKIFFKNQGFPSLEPTRETMVWHLYDLLNIPMPSTSLLCLDEVYVRGDGAKEFFIHGRNKEPFVVQASWGVRGRSADSLFKELSMKDLTKNLRLDNQAYGLQVLGALLSTSGDGKPDNFMIDGESLISIDNDDVLRGYEEKGLIRFKSLLLTLPHVDEAVHPLVYKLIKDYTPEVFIGDWLGRLQDHQQRYHSLINQSKFILRALKPELQDSQLLSSWVQGHDLGLPLTLSSSIVMDVYKRWKVLEQLSSDQGLRYQDLFEGLDLRVGRAYKHLRQELKDPYTIMMALYGHYNELKEYTHLKTYWSDQEQEALKEEQERLYLSCDSLKEERVLSPEDLLEKWIKRQEGWNDAVIQLTLRDKAHRRIRLLTPQGLLQDSRTAVTLALESQQERVWTSLRTHHPAFNWQMTLEEHFNLSKEEKYTPTSGSTKGNFINQGFRILSEPLREHLFGEGNPSAAEYFQKRNKHGRGQVSWYPQENPRLYFKIYPELPGYEYAATLFMRKMKIKRLPESELLAFYDPRTRSHYPVLVSQAIEGTPLCEVWKDEGIFKDLDPIHTGLQILASLLNSPEDAKEDNFILSSDGKYLIPIDSDHAFMPGALRKTSKEFFKGWTIQEKLQTKSLLFALNMMKKALSEEVRQAFLKINPDIFLEEWLQKLMKVNDRYQGLFTSNELVSAAEKGSIVRIPLSPDYMEQVHWKFHTLQERIRQDPDLTYLDLLTLVEPYVGKQYKRAFEDKDKKTVRERFMGVTEGLYKSSRTTAINSREMMEILSIPHQDLVGTASQVKLGPDRALSQLQKLIEAREESQKRQASLIQGEEVLLQGYTGQGKTEKEQQVYLQKIAQTLPLMEELTLSYVDALSPSSIELLRVQQGHQLKGIKVLDLRGCKYLGDSSLHLLAEMCPQLNYLNVSEWQELYVIAHPQEYSWGGFFNDILSEHVLRPTLELFPSLKRLVMNDLPKLQRVSLKAPQLLRIEGTNIPKLKEVALYAPFLTHYGVEEGESFYREDLFDYFYSHSFPIEQIKGLSSHLQQYSGKERSVKDINIISEALKRLDIKVIASRFPNLTSLHLGDNKIDDEGARAIAGSQTLTGLTSLNLRGNEMRAAGARALAGSQTLTGLTSLNLGVNKIGVEGAKAIARSTTLSSLTFLILESNKIGDEGARAIAGSQTLTGLTSLYLGFNEIGAEGAKAIAESEILTGLTSLNLIYNNIGDEGTRAIAESEILTGLTSLYLRSNNIGAEGASFIAGSYPLSGLTFLDLRSNYIGDEGAKAIAGSQTLTGLTSLNLWNNKIGDDGRQAFQQNPLFKRASIDF